MIDYRFRRLEYRRLRLLRSLHLRLGRVLVGLPGLKRASADAGFRRTSSVNWRTASSTFPCWKYATPRLLYASLELGLIRAASLIGPGVHPTAFGLR